VANEAEIREQHDQVEAAVVSLRSHLPSEDQLSEVIERLSELARRTGVRLETVSPQLVPAQLGGEDSMPEEVYQVIPIQVEASAGYHDIGAFLSLIETESSPMELVELRITGHPSDPYRHKLALVLNVFFITRQEAGLSS
jgi:Tfp pilus assembly protein PilO